MKLLPHILELGGTGKVGCSVLAAVAQKAGCKPTTLYMITLGHKVPSWRLAEAIEQATRGAVTKRDLRPDIYGEADQPEGQAA